MVTQATAPESGLAPPIWIDVDLVDISEQHKRTHWGDLDALGESMLPPVPNAEPGSPESRRQGQKVPCCVRRSKKAGRYDLIDGARRHTAAMKKGIKRLLCFVEDGVTDLDLLRRQLLHASSVPLHPMDEAEIFAEMALHKLTAAAIAAQVGRDVGEVKRSLVIAVRLCPAARAWYRSGQVSDMVAFAAARIHDAELQEKQLARVIAEKMYEPDALRLLRASATRLLSLAPWGMGERSLNSESFVAPAPTCDDCNNRTGRQRDLFPDVEAKGKSDYCTNLACYEDKLLCAVGRAVEEANRIGAEVIDPPGAAKLFVSYDVGPERRPLNHACGYVDAERKAQASTHGPEERKTWRAYFGGLQGHALAIDPDGFPRWLFREKDARGLFVKKEKAAKKEAKEKADEKRKKEDQKKDREEIQIRAAVIDALIDEGRVAATADVPLAKLLRLAAQTLAQHTEGGALVASSRELGDGVDQLQKRIGKMGEPDLRGLVAEMCLRVIEDNDLESAGDTARACKELGVDVDAVRARTIEMIKASEEAARS